MLGTPLTQKIRALISLGFLVLGADFRRWKSGEQVYLGAVNVE